MPRLFFAAGARFVGEWRYAIAILFVSVVPVAVPYRTYTVLSVHNMVHKAQFPAIRNVTHRTALVIGQFLVALRKK